MLIVGADFLVKGASSIALRLHISPLVVGLTIVAFGTSVPELLISLKSALSGSPDLAIGNVVGSNICNLGLVLGITAIIGPIRVGLDTLRLDWPVTMGSSSLLYAAILGGVISFFEGAFFVVLLIIYNVYIIRASRKEMKREREIAKEFDLPTESTQTLLNATLFIVLGSVGLYFGSEWFVGGAQSLAVFLGVSERIIGITLLALGTSLPELVTAMVAAFKSETDLALGNLLGSNIFNILSILGITSMVTEVPVNEVIISNDILWMLGITLLLLPIMLIKRQITRFDGVILLGVYVVYTYRVIFI